MKKIKIKKNKKNKSTKITPWYVWGIKILVLSFILSLVFSFFTEIVMSNSSLVIAIIVLIVLLFMNIISDTIATATTSCTLESFLSMSTKNIKGAKTAVKLVKNAHKVSSICADVIGDICGIISGSAGAAIILILNIQNPTFSLVASILISSLIASLTVGGKAFAKTMAIKNNEKIVYIFARCISIFQRKK